MTKSFSNFCSYVDRNYVPSGVHINNPGRGFNFPKSGRLSKNNLDNHRFQDGVTHIWLQYTLTEYLNVEFPGEFFELLDADMAVLREAGMTCLLRFR